MTVSKAADRSSRMRTDDLESAFAIRRASVTESSAVSVEWPILKPDCLASSLLFCERNNETWLKTTRSSILAMNGRRETGLKFSIREVFNVGFLSSGVSLVRCSRRTSDNQGLEGAVRAGLEERGQISSRRG